MLVPLSIFDENAQDITVILAHVVAVDETWTTADNEQFVERLKAAASRVVSKWRVLQGVVKRLENGRWAIDVPEEGASIPHNHFGFVTETVDLPYHVASGRVDSAPPLSSAPSGFFPMPNFPLFRSFEAPVLLAQYEQQQSPFLHIKVTVLADAFAIGISLAHGIFDGFGMGLVVQALDAELNGKAWPFEVPPLFGIEEGNPVVNTLNSLDEDEAVSAEGGWASEVFDAARNSDGQTAGDQPPSMPRFGFLRKVAVEKLVDEVKEVVKNETGGKDYVSTSDVLTAWLAKAAQAHDRSDAAYLKLITLFNPRAQLDSYESSSSASSSFSTASYPLPTYPHNLTLPYDLVSPTPFTLSRLHDVPLPDLALLLHRGLDAHRSSSAIKSTWRRIAATEPFPWVSEWAYDYQRPPSPSAAAPVPLRYSVSNQLGLHFADIHFPGRDDKPLTPLAFHFAAMAPGQFTNVVALQDVEAGVTFTATLSPEAWKGVEEAIEDLEKKARGDKV
ncbi:hypothetical protein JCM8097_002014 [Rhodosporidiobolus ruineniae]